jgi:hypothetical protein
MVDQKKIELDRKHKAMEARIAVLQAEFEAEKTEVLKMIAIDESKSKQLLQNQSEMAFSRKADNNEG